MRRIRLAAVGTAGLLAIAGISALAAGAHPRAGSESLKIKLWGARLSTGDYAFKVVSSLDGTGAAVTRVTSATSSYPVIGTSVTTVYFPDGVSKQHVSFKQDAPNSQGISKFTGSGRCTGGSRIHKRETCQYTFTGTYNIKTNQNDLTITGADSR
jgi:hypothetical protein